MAKTILFRRAEAIVRGMQFGGYRRNIVTYALARLAHATRHQLDLGAVWIAQETPTAVDDAIESLAQVAFDVLTDPSRPAANVTEWAKRVECWEAMIRAPWAVPDQLASELTGGAGRTEGATENQPQSEELPLPEGITGDTFLELAHWAHQSEKLSAFDRALAKRLGIALKQGRTLTARQRPEALRLLDEAQRLLVYAPREADIKTDPAGCSGAIRANDGRQPTFRGDI